jgi:integrase/recombinase XerD
MTCLHAVADEYLTLRRSLGFKLQRHGRLLNDFIDSLDEVGATTVTTELAVAWATAPTEVAPDWWATRLSVVRGFARYLQAIDPATEVPPVALFPNQPRRATPYLYSDDEVARLVAVARTLTPALRAATYPTLICLLAATGMRISEALGLDRDDVDLAAGLITIRHTKFDKSRQLPLHPTTVEALHWYAQQRDRCCPRPSTTSFLVTTRGTRPHYSTIQSAFKDLVAAAGLQPRSPRCRPRLHSFRHSFAVTTLVGWYQTGVDVQARLPLLSTYLGHVNPANTYWYLSASPELLDLARQRLQDALGATA